MTPEKLTEILYLAENLKKNTRHSWLSNGRRESVAEHSWRLSLFAYFVKDEFPNVDMDKVIMMCIFHDLGRGFYRGAFRHFIRRTMTKKSKSINFANG